MARGSHSRQTTGDGTTDEALSRALRQRSAQRITDLREPLLRATGTERIAQMLAEAREARDGESDASHHDSQGDAAHAADHERPSGARLRWWVPPLGAEPPEAASDSGVIG